MRLDKKYRAFMAGGAASCVAEMGTFPIDLVKTRLQVQGQVIDGARPTMQYKNMFHAFWKISTTEGVSKLFSGMSAAFLRQAVYGTIKIGLYQNFKIRMNQVTGGETYLGTVACAVAAGSISGSIANPTDVLRVRFQTGNERFRGMGLIRAFATTFHEEGFNGLYRGVYQTATRAAIVSACELSMYDFAKRNMVSHGMRPDSLLTHFMGSLVAGFCAGVGATPVDVIRSRLMNQQCIKVPSEALKTVEASSAGVIADAGPLIYRNGMHCLLETVRNEGPLALYKGFWPCVMRMGPWNVLFFMSYEQFSKMLQ